MKFGEKFYEHFNIEEETYEYYKVRCKESGEEYKLYKCRLQNNNYICKKHICRGCGEKIPLFNRDNYYLDTYYQMLDEYFSTTDPKRKKSLQKCIYYYRDKANVSQEEFRKAQYLARVKELDESILKVSSKKKEYLDFNVDYVEYKQLYNKTRNLFLSIKRVVPEFTPYNNFSDYKNHILGGEVL